MKFRLIEDNLYNIPKIVIDVDINYEQDDLNEDLPSGTKNASYDDQTINDWYDFTSNVAEVIEEELGLDIVNTIHSSKGNKLSTYYNFYIKDKDGNPKVECLINLRVSDHNTNDAINDNRRRHVKNLIKDTETTSYRLNSITVNNNKYKTYEQALTAVKNLLNKIIEEKN